MSVTNVNLQVGGYHVWSEMGATKGLLFPKHTVHEWVTTNRCGWSWSGGYLYCNPMSTPGYDTDDEDESVADGVVTLGIYICHSE